MIEKWTQDIPLDQIQQVHIPLFFEHFRDHEARAEKVLGYDDKGDVCYYRHVYSLTESFLDEDDLACESEVFFETLTAWRLFDQRWLTCLRQGGEQGFCKNRLRPPTYAVAEERPR